MIARIKRPYRNGIKQNDKYEGKPHERPDEWRANLKER